MDKELLKKHFFNFLKEKEAYTEYKKYLGCLESRNGILLPTPTQRIVNLNSLNTMHPRLWIDVAFPWEISESGKDFWLRLDNEWYKILHNLKEF